MGEHLSSTDVARLNEALKALPAEIAASLRSAPLGVKEVRSRWLRWLAVAGVVVAIGSGIYTLVSALTTPSVVRQVAPISRTAERLDRGLNGLERPSSAPGLATRPRGSGSRPSARARRAAPPARVLHRRRRLPRHLDAMPMPGGPGPAAGWRARIAPGR